MPKKASHTEYNNKYPQSKNSPVTFSTFKFTLGLGILPAGPATLYTVST